MNVFISQTKGKSQEVAEVVRVWLQSEMQLCDPWMSPSDIKGGDNWREEINKALEEARFGIIFLTADNVKNPWIFFEAGILILKGIKVFPYVIDLDRLGKLPAPINHLQGERVGRKATEHLVIAIHEALGKPFSSEALLATFESKWGKLEKDLNDILDPPVDYYQNIIDDFTEVFLDVNKYREGLDFSPNVDEAIELLIKQKNENGKEVDVDCVHKLIEDKMVDSVYRVIEKEREKFNRESKLIGNVSDFFREHFEKKDLRNVINRLSPSLWSDLPLVEKVKELQRRVKIQESEVYLHYHQILLDKLKARIIRK
jgi:hypothetical protein